MATQHLDLEEQEQLAQLKHFWNRWGNLITWALIAVLGAFAAWNGWNFWQQRQAVQAAALYSSPGANACRRGRRPISFGLCEGHTSPAAPYTREETGRSAFVWYFFALHFVQHLAGVPL